MSTGCKKLCPYCKKRIINADRIACPSCSHANPAVVPVKTLNMVCYNEDKSYQKHEHHKFVELTITPNSLGCYSPYSHLYDGRSHPFLDCDLSFAPSHSGALIHILRQPGKQHTHHYFSLFPHNVFLHSYYYACILKAFLLSKLGSCLGLGLMCIVLLSCYRKIPHRIFYKIFYTQTFFTSEVIIPSTTEGLKGDR